MPPDTSSIPADVAAAPVLAVTVAAGDAPDRAAAEAFAANVAKAVSDAAPGTNTLGIILAALNLPSGSRVLDLGGAAQGGKDGTRFLLDVFDGPVDVMSSQFNGGPSFEAIPDPRVRPLDRLPDAAALHYKLVLLCPIVIRTLIELRDLVLQNSTLVAPGGYLICHGILPDAIDNAAYIELPPPMAKDFVQSFHVSESGELQLPQYLAEYRCCGVFPRKTATRSYLSWYVLRKRGEEELRADGPGLAELARVRQVEPALQRARAALRSDRLEDAAAGFEAALAAGADEALCRRNLARIYERSEEWGKALENWERLRECDPNDAVVQSRIARLSDTSTLPMILAGLDLPAAGRVLDIGGAVQGGKDSTRFLFDAFDGPIDVAGHLSGTQEAFENPFGERARILDAVPDRAVSYDLVLLCPIVVRTVIDLREFATNHSHLVAPGGYLICCGILPGVIGNPDYQQPAPRLHADFSGSFTVAESGELQLPFFLAEYQCCGVYPRKSESGSYLGWYVLRKRGEEELRAGGPGLAELARVRQVEPALRRARDALRSGRPEDAAAGFEAALAAGADEALCHRHLARIYERSEQWEKALDHWQWLHGHEPQQAEPAVRLARVCLELGRYEDAAAGFEAALAAGADEALCRRNLARIYERTEEWGKALESWERLRERDPNDAVVQSRIARLSDTSTLPMILAGLDLPAAGRVLDIGGAVQGGKDSTRFLFNAFDGPIDVAGHLSGQQEAFENPFGERVRRLDAVPDRAVSYDLVLLCPIVIRTVIDLREFATNHSHLVSPGGYLICHGILPGVIGNPDYQQPAPRLHADFSGSFTVSESGELQLPFFLAEYQCCGIYRRKRESGSYLGWYVLRKRGEEELRAGGPGLAELARVRQVEPALRRARDALQSGRPEDAAAGFEAALAVGADEGLCHRHLARIYERGEEWEKALDHWQWLHGREPQQAEPALRLARVCLELGRYEDAAAGFEAALAVGADEALCRRNLARIYERTEQWERALESWERLRTCDPTDLAAPPQIARLQFKLGRYDTTQASFDADWVDDSRDPDMAARLARRLSEAQQRLAERTIAIEKLRQTIANQRDRLAAYNGLRAVAQPVWFAERLLNAKDALRADAYVAHTPRSLPGLARLSQLVGGRFLCDVVEIPSIRDWAVTVAWPDPVITLLDSAFERLLEQCHALLTIGPTLAGRLAQYGPPVHVIENYRPLEPPVRSNSLREMCGLQADERLILALSTQASGFEDVVDCLALLPSNVHLAVVGHIVPKDYETAIHQLVANRQLDQRVHFIDVVPYSELTTTASSADVGLIIRDPKILNNYVSLPNRVFDYICSGLPICAPNIPDINSYLHRFDLGEVVYNTDAAGWAAAISKVLQRRDELHKNALAAAAELTWETREEPLCRIFEGMERVVFTDYGPLHLNNRTLRMCQSLQQRGHRVTLCTNTPKDPTTLVPGIQYHFI